MKVIEVRERSSVEIPLSELLHDGGGLRIRPDLVGKGLVELRQNRTSLSLRINGVIGFVPITDSLALDISPKFPIKNLNRMIYQSEVYLRNPFDHDRPYEKQITADYLPVPLVRSFATALNRLVLDGIFRTYVRETVEGAPKPRINFMRSYRKFWCRLQPTRSVSERFDYSIDNTANQIIKLAAIKALALSRESHHLKDYLKPLAEALRQLERVTTKSPQQLSAYLANAQNLVPTFRDDYQHTLRFAAEIILSSDFLLDSSQTGLSLESFIISLDEVFERYLRKVLSNIEMDNGNKFITVDGNIKRHQRPLFFDNKKYTTKPDFVVKSGEQVVLIGDAKYKVKPKEEDRYQMISHALSYGVNKAVIVYPCRGSDAPRGLVRLGSIGSIERPLEIFEMHYDLEGDLELEEQQLRLAIAGLISPSITTDASQAVVAGAA